MHAGVAQVVGRVQCPYDSRAPAQLEFAIFWYNADTQIKLGEMSHSPRRYPERIRGRLQLTVSRASALAVVLILATAPLARGQNSQPADSLGTIVGFVVMRDGDLPLAYSVVSAPGLERFTNDRGVFTLTDVRPGPLRLRVRHLGYTPADVVVDVHAGTVDTLRVRLVHIAVQLTAVRVRAYPECKNPGPPQAALDSGFATVFQQLRQNAEQYALLTSAYPFEYSVERTLANTTTSGEFHVERTDTVAMRSTNEWQYRPGAVVRPESSPRLGQREYMLHIPTLIQFADTVFLTNHCFHNGGVEIVEGVDLVRVDFVAASRIKDPDVDGSMYLDPASFQIRRAFLHLSKVPREIRGLLETEATTVFAELLPSIPIISGISSINRIEVNRRRPNAIATWNEEQRLVSVHFLNGKPGDDVRKP